jgi:hypothetical protein
MQMPGIVQGPVARLRSTVHSLGVRGALANVEHDRARSAAQRSAVDALIARHLPDRLESAA